MIFLKPLLTSNHFAHFHFLPYYGEAHLELRPRPCRHPPSSLVYNVTGALIHKNKKLKNHTATEQQCSRYNQEEQTQRKTGDDSLKQGWNDQDIFYSR